jgi:hypothetical protein
MLTYQADHFKLQFILLENMQGQLKVLCGYLKLKFNLFSL